MIRIKKHYIALTFLILIVVAVVVILRLDNKKDHFQVSTTEMLEDIFSPGDTVTPQAAMAAVDRHDPDWLFIDLRNHADYLNGHIDGAVNIPMPTILNDEFREMLDESRSKTIVLYGSDQLQANGPWMLLRQLGYDNVSVLMGGYEFYSARKNVNDTLQAMQGYDIEEARYNFADLQGGSKGQASQSGQSAKEPLLQPQLVVPQKRKQTASGGC